MALTSGEWTALAGVLAVIVAVYLYNQMRAKTAPIQAGEEAPTVDPRLSRFAVHDGDVVGETVTVDGDALILKQAGAFKSVPQAQASLHGDEVKIHGDIDWAASEEAGAAWLEANRKGQDDQVTAELTTSDDVKAPAREAFEARQKDLDSEE